MKAGIILSLALVMIGGWIMNLVKLVNMTATIADWTALEVLRLVGVFVFPLGALLGYFP